MKRRALSLIASLSLLLTSSNFVFSIPASAASVGSGNCVQTVDDSNGVAVYEASGSCYIAFKSIGTRVWTVPANAIGIDYLVVAGGGSGGSRHAGGGGAGGMITGTRGSLAGITALSLTIGGGGSAVTPSSNNYATGLSGSNSSLAKYSGSGTLTTLTAIGGGGGEGGGVGAQGGGSGGGTQNATVSTATSGQGNAGGTGGTNNSNWWSGGGGGAGEAGKNGTISGGGNGGAGAVWLASFTTEVATGLGLTQTGQTQGNQVYFSGGGGGSITSSPAGSGGLGGGGAASLSTSNATAGTANSGGGGGGAGCCSSTTSGAGGSGVVIIRYTIPVSYFSASNYTAGSTTWSNSISGATAGTAPTGGMAKTSSTPTGVVFAGNEASNSDQLTLSIGSTSALDTITVEMWLKLKDNGSTQNAYGSMLFSWTSGSNYNIYHYQNQVGFNNFQSQLYGVDSTSYNNAWTHYVFVLTDTGPWSSQKVYINGALQASTCRVTASACTDAQARPFGSTGAITLMNNPNSAGTWHSKGDLGLVRIYNQELSSTNIQTLYDSTSPSYAEAPDTTAPTFSSSASFTAAENIATSATAATISVSESSTITISSGSDAARFNIYFSDSTTALVKFKVSPDYESPSDVGGNNVYELTITATDPAANAGTQAITITVTDIVDTSSITSFMLNGSVTTASYRTAIAIKAYVTVSSKVTFKANNVRIPGCINVRTTGTSPNILATCSWKASRRGNITLSATAAPTSAGISGSNATPLKVYVSKRVGIR